MNKVCIRAGLLAALAMALVVPAAAYEVGDIMRTVLYERGQRLKNVDVLVKRIKNNELPGVRLGMPNGAEGKCVSDCVVYKVEDVTVDGTTTRQERALTPLEVQRLAGLSPEADTLELFGAGMVEGQAAFNEATGGEDIGSVLTGIRERDWENRLDGDVARARAAPVLEARKPWLNPWRMMAAGGVMMQDGADAIRQADASLATSQAQAQADSNKAAVLYSSLQPAGSEAVSGRQTDKFSSSGMNVLMESTPEYDVYFNGADVWIDPAKNVFVRHRINGTMTAEGEAREFFIDVRYDDFRDVPGCDLYEPYRRVMSMGGMMDDEQMAQMKEAQRQLADFDKQMASMPPDQRKMVERMMGGQMETIRNMANSGTMEFVEETTEILCNPDLKALFDVTGAATTTTLAAPPENLLQQIQRNLSKLGYEPGNTDGVLDVATQIAISQYQAERGMSVTGEPSQALASALAADVANR